MKHLSNFIFEDLFDSMTQTAMESLFDKDLITNPSVVEKATFEDYNSDFWKFLRPGILNSSSVIPLSPTQIEDINPSIDIDKKIIDVHRSSININDKMKNPFVNKYILQCDKFVIGNEMGSGPHPDPILNGAGFKEIRVSNRIIIDGLCDEISDFKFEISNTEYTFRGKFPVRITWADHIFFNNVSFEFEKTNDGISFYYLQDFPDLRKVKSNCKMITLYDSNLFDQDKIKNKLNKFFGDGEITANGITKKKNIRNIVAMVNNIKKYNSIDPRQLIPVGKVSDLIDLSGFDNINYIQMRNNNVHIYFVRLKNDEYIERYAKFVRLMNMKEYKNYSISQMIDLVKSCHTSDGWVLGFQPDTF